MPSSEFINRSGCIWDRFSFQGKSMEEIRKGMDDSVMSELKLPAGVMVTRGECGGVPGRWARKAEENGKLMYYIHGGGFTLGSSGIPMPFITELVSRLGIACFSIDYRLAPEYVFPAAAEDVLRGYLGLLELRYRPENIVVCGESAGGSLSLALLHQLKKEGAPYPAAAVALSPVTDARPRMERSGNKVINDLPDTDEVWRIYAPGADREDPRLSPALGDMTGFPPVFLFAGGAEPLAADSLEFVRNAVPQGVDVRLTVGRDMVHTYPLDLFDYPEAMEAFEEIELYFRQRLNIK